MLIEALTIRPDLAKVGCEIRVVGNDNGEKLSILSGVIGRLDGNAPEYGRGTYNDFNTNYIQAAASASGGSSGSPVVNVDGHVVAIAGGCNDSAATNYFLPLDRPLRALECIRNDQPVTRGTIQTQWIIKPIDECRRLGLTPEWEATIRERLPKVTGQCSRGGRCSLGSERRASHSIYSPGRHLGQQCRWKSQTTASARWNRD